MRREDVIIFEGEHQFVVPKNRVRNKKTGMSYNVPEVGLVGDEVDPEMMRPLSVGGGSTSSGLTTSTTKFVIGGSIGVDMQTNTTRTTTRFLPTTTLWRVPQPIGSTPLTTRTTTKPYITPPITSTTKFSALLTTRTTTKFSIASFPTTTRAAIGTTTKFSIASFPTTTRAAIGTTTKFSIASFPTTRTTVRVIQDFTPPLSSTTRFTFGGGGMELPTNTTTTKFTLASITTTTKFRFIGSGNEAFASTTTATPVTRTTTAAPVIRTTTRFVSGTTSTTTLRTTTKAPVTTRTTTKFSLNSFSTTTTIAKTTTKFTLASITTTTKLPIVGGGGGGIGGGQLPPPIITTLHSTPILAKLT